MLVELNSLIERLLSVADVRRERETPRFDVADLYQPRRLGVDLRSTPVVFVEWIEALRKLDPDRPLLAWFKHAIPVSSSFGYGALNARSSPLISFLTKDRECLGPAVQNRNFQRRRHGVRRNQDIDILAGLRIAVVDHFQFEASMCKVLVSRCQPDLKVGIEVG